MGNVIGFRQDEGEHPAMSQEEWLAFASRRPFYKAREKARALGVHIPWDCEHAKTPDGYYQVRGGIDYAIAKSLAAAPFADLLWMETKTADLHDAKRFAEAIHAVFPDKMLAYNLSPSFNWDTTGMNDEQMRRFPEELGKMGFVFNFITYGGHQIDGLASEEFATALRQDGMLALARLQRKFRLLESRLPHAADAGGRAARGRRADGDLGPHLDHQGHGPGLDAAPAPGADRGAAQGARGLARPVAQAPRRPGQAARLAASRAPPAPTCSSWRWSRPTARRSST